MGALMSVIWPDSAIGGRTKTAATAVETCRETGSRAALPHAGQAMPGAAINGSEHASFRSTAPSPMVRVRGVSDPTDRKDGPQNGVCRRLSLRRNVPGRGLKTAGHRLAAWAGMLIVAFVALSATIAQAQSPVNLVSNTGQNRSATAASMMAQGFTTGSVSAGYTLTSVGVRLGADNDDGEGILVRIYSVDSDGEPDSVVHTLTNPGTITTGSLLGDINTFTAAAGATLAASTTYSVVVTNADGDGSPQYSLWLTNSTNEDNGAATGWSIANTRYFSTTTFGTWTSSTSFPQIEVRGPAPATSTDATLSGLELEDTSDDSTIAISPTFASATTSYTATVANSVDEILVDPTTNDGNATVEFLNASDMAISDADSTEEGHQVALAVGSNTIKVKVTAEDGMTTQTYTVEVTRAAPVVQTTVTQTAGGATWTLTGPAAVTAGQTYTYTMTLASGTKPNNEYAGFYLPNSATNQDTLGLDPDNCASPKNFCASFTGGGAQNGIWDNVQGHDTRYNVLSNTSPHTLTATFKVAATAPDGTEITFGAIENNGAPRAGGLTITVGTASDNNAATGDVTISGVPQVGNTLNATISNVMDDDGLTNPTYTYQWQRETSPGVTANIGTNSSSYTVTADDVGKRIRVQVSFVDDDSNSEALNSDYTVAAVAAAGACPAVNDWCETLTVGTVPITVPDPGTTYGFSESVYGSLPNLTITDGGGTSYTVRQIVIHDFDSDTDLVEIILTDFLPRGSVFNLGGEEFTADATSEQSTTGFYLWDRPSGFTWIAGQTVTVSVKFPATSTDATLSGLELEDTSDDSTIAISPTFASNRANYTASVANDVDEILVDPTTTDDGATVEFLNAADNDINDADSTEEGHQVALAVGANTIKVKVTAEDAMTTQTYTVIVTRAPAPMPSGRTLVSTLGQTSNSTGVLTSTARIATKFSVPAGADYRLTSVIVNIEGGGGVDAAIHAVSTGNANIPSNTRLYELTRPSQTSAGNRTFTAPAGTVLAGGTEYFVVMSGSSTRILNMTTNNGEDAGSLPGWTVANDSRRFNGSSWDSTTNTLRMRLTGFEAVSSAACAPNGHQVELSISSEADPPPTIALSRVGHDCLGTVTNYSGKPLTGVTISVQPRDGFTTSMDIITGGYMDIVNGGYTDGDGNRIEDTGGWIVGDTLTASMANPGRRHKFAVVLAEKGVAGTSGHTRHYSFIWLDIAGSGLRVADAQANEAHGHMYFTVTMQPAQRTAVTVDYATENGTATAPGDYTATSGTLTFEPGETSKTVAVPLIDDTIKDNGERFRLKLSNATGGVAIADGTGIGTIRNTEGPLVSVADASATEGSAVAFTVSLAEAGTEPGTVAYATSGDTATSGTDFTATSGTLTFEPGETSKTVSVATADDTTDEADETFTLTLSSPTNLRLGTATATGTIEDDDEATGLTASFTEVPASHDGSSAFTLRLAFSEAIATGFRVLRDEAFTVTGGEVNRAKRVDRRSDLWDIRIEPSGSGAVTVSLPATTGECTATGAICTSEGLKLSAAASTEIAGPTVTPLTASFENVPSEHDGSGSFTIQVSFSEALASGGSGRKIAQALALTGATRGEVRRVDGRRDLYWFRVHPSGNDAVTVTLTSTGACGGAAAVCTSDGRALSNAPAATIQGPPSLAVADAEANEGPNAALAFAVTLSRAASGTVAVDYATSDVTATAGDDYTATSGTLTFAAGETSKTVSVPVLDDAHDDDGETLTLTLSNPSGAFISDATATGTIHNEDLMPQAWLARFGRTVAEQAIDAVESRLRSAPRPGAEVTLAGERIGWAPAPEHEETRKAAGEEAREAEAQARVDRLAVWLRGEAEDGNGAQARSRSVMPRELLTGSSFALTAEPGGAGGGIASLWGRGALSSFDGREGELSLSGEVTSVMLGADWTRETWTAGLMLSHSRGEGSYSGATGGKVSSALTGLYPYGRYALNDRVTVWGTAGYGAGTLTLTPEGDEPIETDMDLKMAAAGLRGVVVRAPAGGGPELAVKTDAMMVQTSSDAVAGDLSAADAEVTRLRLGLEGSWRGVKLGTGTLEPRLEVGLRQDGGDAETGLGLDLGGGLAWSDPETGIRAEVSGRGLLTHESAGFRQRGFAGSLGWDPRPGSARGPSLTLRQTLGLSASGGADALLNRGTLEGLAANDDGNELDRRRLELKFGYGFAAVGDRFTSAPELGFGMSEGHREYSLGWRLARDPRPGDIGSLELLFEARRQESANDNDPPEHRLGFRIAARF